jgi:two-component system, NtrC family, nitrogen regulation sensor histidine kinase NtrY
MVSNSRPFHILAIGLLVVAAVFAYDSAIRGLWAGLFVGIAACIVLAGTVWASQSARVVRAFETGARRNARDEDLRVILDQLPVPLVRHVEGQRPEALNRAARALFRTDDVIVDDMPELVRAMTEAASGSQTVLPVLGGQYAVSVSEVASDGGHARLAALTDVQTEMHKAEAAAMRDTLQVLSHEIMNSLTPVASLAEVADAFLDKTPSDVDSAREALATLSRRAAGLTRFIEAYRSVARLPDPVLQPVEPARLVRDVSDLFVRAPGNAGIAWEIEAGEALPRLNLDEPQISQALINVITNAIEATDGMDGLRRIRVTDAEVQHNVVITISDNGPGVPDALRPNLFTAFATTKPGGTGTGLNLARQIALAHGGNLQLISRSGEPAAFAFSFPVRS